MTISFLGGFTACVGLAAMLSSQQPPAPEGVRNYTRIDATFACAGATPASSIPALKEQGFASIINFRMADEPGADVEGAKAAAEKAGIKYIHLPFRTPTNEVADAFLKAVTDKANQPALVHCAGANRAASMWMIKRMKVDGWDAERAAKEAEQLGMTSPNLKQFAIEYATKK